MSIPKSSRITPLLKGIAIFVAFCFTFTTLAWSAPILELPIHKNEIAVSPLAYQIEIPESLGTIKERFAPDFRDGSHEPIAIIHIQDAHANYEAQVNTKKILEHLKQEYGMDLVFLEGGIEKFDPKQVQFLKDPERAKKTADLLTQDGVISGAELFLLEERLGEQKRGQVRFGNSVPVPFSAAYGVEDPNLYRENLDTFQAVIEKKTLSGPFLRHVQAQILTESSRRFNKKLQEFFKLWVFYENTQSEWIRHLGFLHAYAREMLNLDLTDPANQWEWPQLLRFFKLQGLEDKINLEKARQDIRKLNHWLARHGVSMRLIQGVLRLDPLQKEKNQSRWKEETPRHFLEGLYREMSPKGFSFKHYPYFSQLAGVTILQNELEAAELLGETNRLTNLLLRQLAIKKEEREILSLYQDLLLLKKLFSLELVREDYKQVKRRVKQIQPSVLIQRLQALNPKVSAASPQTADHRIFLKTTTADRGLPAVDLLFKRALAFYRTAREREEVIFQKTISKMKELKNLKAVLITGGFHSGGLLAQFKEKGISYVEITPHLSELTDHKTYQGIMTMQADFLTLHSNVQTYGPRILASFGASHISRPRTDAWIMTAARDAYSDFARQYSGENFLNRFQDEFGNSPAAQKHGFQLTRSGDSLSVLIQDEQGRKDFVRHPKNRNEIFTISDRRLDFKPEGPQPLTSQERDREGRKGGVNAFRASSDTVLWQSTEHRLRPELKLLSDQTWVQSSSPLFEGQSESTSPPANNTTIAIIKRILRGIEEILLKVPPITAAIRKAWKRVSNVLDKVSSLFGVQKIFIGLKFGFQSFFYELFIEEHATQLFNINQLKNYKTSILSTTKWATSRAEVRAGTGEILRYLNQLKQEILPEQERVRSALQALILHIEKFKEKEKLTQDQVIFLRDYIHLVIFGKGFQGYFRQKARNLAAWFETREIFLFLIPLLRKLAFNHPPVLHHTLTALDDMMQAKEIDFNSLPLGWEDFVDDILRRYYPKTIQAAWQLMAKNRENENEFLEELESLFNDPEEEVRLLVTELDDQQLSFEKKMNLLAAAIFVRARQGQNRSEIRHVGQETEREEYDSAQTHLRKDFARDFLLKMPSDLSGLSQIELHIPEKKVILRSKEPTDRKREMSFVFDRRFDFLFRVMKSDRIQTVLFPVPLIASWASDLSSEKKGLEEMTVALEDIATWVHFGSAYRLQSRIGPLWRLVNDEALSNKGIVLKFEIRNPDSNAAATPQGIKSSSLKPGEIQKDVAISINQDLNIPGFASPNLFYIGLSQYPIAEGEVEEPEAVGMPKFMISIQDPDIIFFSEKEWQESIRQGRPHYQVVQSKKEETQKKKKKNYGGILYAKIFPGKGALVAYHSKKNEVLKIQWIGEGRNQSEKFLRITGPEKFVRPIEYVIPSVLRHFDKRSELPSARSELRTTPSLNPIGSRAELRSASREADTGKKLRTWRSELRTHSVAALTMALKSFISSDRKKALQTLGQWSAYKEKERVALSALSKTHFQNSLHVQVIVALEEIGLDGKDAIKSLSDLSVQDRDPKVRVLAGQVLDKIISLETQVISALILVLQDKEKLSEYQDLIRGFERILSEIFDFSAALKKSQKFSNEEINQRTAAVIAKLAQINSTRSEARNSSPQSIADSPQVERKNPWTVDRGLLTEVFSRSELRNPAEIEIPYYGKISVSDAGQVVEELRRAAAIRLAIGDSVFDEFAALGISDYLISLHFVRDRSLHMMTLDLLKPVETNAKIKSIFGFSSLMPSSSNLPANLLAQGMEQGILRLEQMVQVQASSEQPVVLSFLGGGGMGTSTLAHVIQQTGMGQISAQKIQVIDSDIYIPRFTERQGEKVYTHDSAGFFRIPPGDFIENHLNLARFRQDFTQAAKQSSLVIVSGVHSEFLLRRIGQSTYLLAMFQVPPPLRAKRVLDRDGDFVHYEGAQSALYRVSRYRDRKAMADLIINTSNEENISALIEKLRFKRAEVRTALQDVLQQKGIRTDLFTTVIYPASGNYDGTLLAMLKSKAFGQIQNYHLISLSYKESESAGALVKKNILDQLGLQDSVEVHLYPEDYYKVQLDLSPEGKRIWIDKGPDRNGEMRQEKLYQTAVEKGHIRPGDLVLTVPTGIKPYRWKNEIASGVKIWEHDDWDNWRVSIVTEEDITAIRSLKNVSPVRSEVRSGEDEAKKKGRGINRRRVLWIFGGIAAVGSAGWLFYPEPEETEMATARAADQFKGVLAYMKEHPGEPLGEDHIFDAASWVLQGYLFSGQRWPKENGHFFFTPAPVPELPRDWVDRLTNRLLRKRLLDPKRPPSHFIREHPYLLLLDAMTALAYVDPRTYWDNKLEMARFDILSWKKEQDPLLGRFDTAQKMLEFLAGRPEKVTAEFANEVHLYASHLYLYSNFQDWFDALEGIQSKTGSLPDKKLWLTFLSKEPERQAVTPRTYFPLENQFEIEIFGEERLRLSPPASLKFVKDLTEDIQNSVLDPSRPEDYRKIQEKVKEYFAAHEINFKPLAEMPELKSKLEGWKRSYKEVIEIVAGSEPLQRSLAETENTTTYEWNDPKGDRLVVRWNQGPQIHIEGKNWTGLPVLYEQGVLGGFSPLQIPYRDEKDFKEISARLNRLLFEKLKLGPDSFLAVEINQLSMRRSSYVVRMGDRRIESSFGGLSGDLEKYFDLKGVTFKQQDSDYQERVRQTIETALWDRFRSEIRSETYASDTAEHSKTGRFGERQGSRMFAVQGSQEPARSEVRRETFVSRTGKNLGTGRSEVRNEILKKGASEDILSRRDFLKLAGAGSWTLLFQSDRIVLAEEKETGKIMLFFVRHVDEDDFKQVKAHLQKTLDWLLREGKTVHFFIEGPETDIEFIAAYELYQALNPQNKNSLSDIFGKDLYQGSLPQVFFDWVFVGRPSRDIPPEVRLIKSIVQDTQRPKEFDPTRWKQDYANALKILDQMDKIYRLYLQILDGKMPPASKIPVKEARQRIQQVFDQYIDALEQTYNKNQWAPFPHRFLWKLDSKTGFFEAQYRFLWTTYGKQLGKQIVIHHEKSLLPEDLTEHSAIGRLYAFELPEGLPMNLSVFTEEDRNLDELGFSRIRHLPAVFFKEEAKEVVTQIPKPRKFSGSLQRQDLWDEKIDEILDYWAELYRKSYGLWAQKRDEQMSRLIAATLKKPEDVALVTRGADHKEGLGELIAQHAGRDETIVKNLDWKRKEDEEKEDLSLVLKEERELYSSAKPPEHLLRKGEKVIALGLIRYLIKTLDVFRQQGEEKIQSPLPKYLEDFSAKLTKKPELAREFFKEALRVHEIYQKLFTADFGKDQRYRDIGYGGELYAIHHSLIRLGLPIDQKWIGERFKKYEKQLLTTHPKDTEKINLFLKKFMSSTRAEIRQESRTFAVQGSQKPARAEVRSAASVGFAHHFRAKSIVQHYDKVFLRGPAYKWQRGDTSNDIPIVIDAKEDLAQARRIEMLKFAIRYLHERGNRLDDPDPEMVQRAARLVKSTTILGLDMPTHLLFYDSRVRRGRVYHLDRRRSVIYFPLRFLDSLEREASGIRELAVYLDRAQRWLDAYQEFIRKQTPAAAIYKQMRDAEGNFPKIDQKILLWGLPQLLARISEMHILDEKIQKKKIFPEIEKLRLETSALNEKLEKKRKLKQLPDRGEYAELADLYGRLAHLQENVGRHDDAIQSYRLQVAALHNLQSVDSGWLPFDKQEKIIMILLLAGLHEEFLQELRVFLTGKGWPRKLGAANRRLAASEWKRIFPQYIQYISGGKEQLKADYLFILQSQEEEARPRGEQVSIRKSVNEVRRLFPDTKTRFLRSEVRAAGLGLRDPQSLNPIGSRDEVRKKETIDHRLQTTDRMGQDLLSTVDRGFLTEVFRRSEIRNDRPIEAKDLERIKKRFTDLSIKVTEEDWKSLEGLALNQLAMLGIALHIEERGMTLPAAKNILAERLTQLNAVIRKKNQEHPIRRAEVRKKENQKPAFSSRRTTRFERSGMATRTTSFKDRISPSREVNRSLTSAISSRRGIITSETERNSPLRSSINTATSLASNLLSFILLSFWNAFGIARTLSKDFQNVKMNISKFIFHYFTYIMPSRLSRILPKGKLSSRSEIRSETRVSDTAGHSETGRFRERQESRTFAVQGSQEPARSEVRSSAELRVKSSESFNSTTTGAGPSLISRQSRRLSEKGSHTLSNFRFGDSWGRSLAETKPLVKIKNNSIISYKSYMEWKAAVQVARITEKIMDASRIFTRSELRRLEKIFGFGKAFAAESEIANRMRILQTKQILSLDLADRLGIKETAQGDSLLLNFKEEELRGNAEFISALSQRFDEKTHFFIRRKVSLADASLTTQPLQKRFGSNHVHVVSNKKELLKVMHGLHTRTSPRILGLTLSDSKAWSEIFTVRKGITLKLNVDEKVRSAGFDEKKMLMASIPLLVLLKEVPDDKLDTVLNQLGLTLHPGNEVRVGFSYLAALSRLAAEQHTKEASLRSA